MTETGRHTEWELCDARMGFFTKDAASSATRPAALQPLSHERVIDAFRRNDWEFDRDEDGDLVINFEGGSYWIILDGEDHEVLHARGVWRGDIPRERMREAGEFCRRWSSRSY